MQTPGKVGKKGTFCPSESLREKLEFQEGYAVYHVVKNKNLLMLKTPSVTLSDDSTSKLTKEDIESSATLLMFNDLLKLLNRLNGQDIKRMLDIGCGYGGLAKTIANYLYIPEVYGLDRDPIRLEMAKKRLQTVKLNVEQKFPFRENIFDLITSFGVLEHLTYFDNVIQEAHRVLKDGGYFLISVPNLASYVNRIMLLFGYQLRDVEISREVVVGLAKRYYDKPLRPIVHIHTLTLAALKELLEFYGYEIVAVRGGSPRYEISHVSLLVRVADLLFSWRPSLCRRIFVLARKS